MPERKMFLLEKGDIIIIRNSAGERITFNRIEDFNLYTDNAWDLSAYWYIDYEPDRYLHIYRLKTDAPGALVHNGNVPDHGMEGVFNQFSLIKSRTEDPFFGKTLEEAKLIAKRNLEHKCMQDMLKELNEDFVLHYLKSETGIYTETDKQARNSRIRPIIEDLETAKQSIDISVDIDSVKTVYQIKKGV